MKNIIYFIKLSSLGGLHAYSQIFFSKSYALAVLLMCISFFDMYGGLCGLLAVALTQITAVAFHANAKSISDGTFSFNALLTGIGIGVMYEFNISVVILVFLASLLSFLVTQYSISYFGGKNLPFLGVPFILVMWIIMSSAPNFSALSLMHKTNFFYSAFLLSISTPVTEYIGGLSLANFLHLYFRSLGAIFFQYNDLAGLIICLGMLFYSRIQFLLSVFGFTIGYIFYIFFEGDFSQLVYSYIGFNFILTAIALGGFFLVPTRRVFLLLVFLTPIIGLLISACHTILFVKLGLPVYALPFNVTVILALATLQAREKATGLFVTTWHEFSPEKVLYTYLFNKKVVKEPHFIPISLPIQGEWYISQAFDGAITHKGEWRFAWDFIKLDENDKPSVPNPKKAADFYCFDEPAYAPADGYVVNMLDGIKDNVLGKIEAEKNWGNVLVIKHAEHLYSSIAHFKAGSFKVNVGDYVKCGQLLGLCGNSGYSYEPHLHFQLQATPNIGAPP